MAEESFEKLIEPMVRSIWPNLVDGFINVNYYKVIYCKLCASHVTMFLHTNRGTAAIQHATVSHYVPFLVYERLWNNYCYDEEFLTVPINNLKNIKKYIERNNLEDEFRKFCLAQTLNR